MAGNFIWMIRNKKLVLIYFMVSLGLLLGSTEGKAGSELLPVKGLKFYLVTEIKHGNYLPDVYFEKNQFTLKPSEIQKLDTIVDFLYRNSNTLISISGHTDLKEKDQENLSAKRAEVVRKYLEMKGIPADRMVTSYYGSRKLMNRCKKKCSEAQRSLNRRVQMDIKLK